jgi:anti-sigma regulatory factor (Ser/Thr protein kinase)
VGLVATALAENGFRHEALLYAGEEGFLAGTVPFIRDAVAGNEPVLVVVSDRKIRALEAELGPDADQVQFADMDELGRNPACIIPAWVQFVEDHAGEARRIRGIGEPISPARSAAELVECHQHESLLNLAFSASPAFWLACPYDTDALTNDVIEEAQHTHPFVSDGNASRASEGYLRPGVGPGPFDGELPLPVGEPDEVAFTSSVHLSAVRAFVAEHGRAAGLDVERTADLALAVSELATNGLLHGGGGGKVRVWPEEHVLLCEVTDRGRRLHRPLQGRERPAHGQTFGRGLWLVNHLCDLVQIRSHPTGDVVRLHMKVG